MLDAPVTSLKGIGPRKAEILRDDAGIETIEDLLYYLPRRYLDRSTIREIRQCLVNEAVTVAGTILDVRLAGQRKKRLEVVIDDGTDALSGIFFGGIEYFKRVFTAGDLVVFSGRIGYYGQKQIVHPDFDFIDTDSRLQVINTGRIIPLYPSTERLKGMGFDSRGFRRTIKTAIDTALASVRETVSLTILSAASLIPLPEAIVGIHFPDSFQHAEAARRRLAFNEMFFHQYYISLVRKQYRAGTARPVRRPDTARYEAFRASLPFQLTADQESAIEAIHGDLARPYPMNRLLQGDVGSGKTVVALAAIVLAAGQGRQSAIMAPTEVLAAQHYNTITRFAGDRLSIRLLTGSTPRDEGDGIRAALAEGSVELVIGTHALIQDAVSFRDLGLIIIDEQHRFGVEQRARLRDKGTHADLLVMSATPIPRSLSLTIYGDLDVSLIRTMPANRLPVQTLSFPVSRIKGVYNSMAKYLDQGRQIFYVLPLIEETEKADLKSATHVYEVLQREVFPERRVALLHGRMKQAQREAVMAGFTAGEIHILVSTTVIEVGIDVPNASIIVIEHAERFGLSQLHQLRGRVGRGHHQSFCVCILPDEVPAESRRRIDVFLSTTDGFAIAEEDLKLRGAGDVMGLRQHGHGLSFEFVDLARDMDIILYARQEAEKLLAGPGQNTADLAHFRERKFNSQFTGVRTRRLLAYLS